MQSRVAAAANTTAWLTKLKAVELHKLAVRIGTPCSGTKAVQIQGIRDALATSTLTYPLPVGDERGQARHNKTSDELHVKSSSPSSSTDNTCGKLSLISIDMGIKNLAYSHWTTHLAPTVSPSSSVTFVQYTWPTLHAWRKIDISETKPPADLSGSSSMDISNISRGDRIPTALPVKAAFEPGNYATRAYDFVKTLIDEHQPTHVVIERQRFRSGGSAAVQEWTIRVGVLEGMLYAVLKTYAALHYQQNELLVDPVLPIHVNRYWLGQDDPEDKDKKTQVVIKKTARDVKLAKIKLVRELLHLADSLPLGERPFVFDKNVAEAASSYLMHKQGAGRNSSSRRSGADRLSSKSSELSKLDDLADCLLQGLGWIHWQNNRFKLAALGQDAISLLD